MRKGLRRSRGAVLAAAGIGLAAAFVAPAARPAPADPGAPSSRPAEEEMRALEQRGRQIALYQQAAARALDMGGRREAGLPLPDRVVVIEGRDGWQAFFLKNPDPGSKIKGMLLLGDVGFDPTSGSLGTPKPKVPPAAAPGSTMTYVYALQTAEAAAAGDKNAKPPFDEAIFKEPDGGYSVYLKSVPRETGSVEAGADLLISVTANGRQVVGTLAYHAAPTSLPLAPRPAGQPTLHLHGEEDLPSPTDVAMLILHPELAPHLVLTPRFMFRIDALGRVTYLGPNASAPAPQRAGGPGGIP